jgi:hypothetical protein
MVTRSDMMMARDAVARAWNRMNAADARWEAEASEAANAEQAASRKAWKKAVMAREAMERRMWAEQDAQRAAA